MAAIAVSIRVRFVVYWDANGMHIFRAMSRTILLDTIQDFFCNLGMKASNENCKFFIIHLTCVKPTKFIKKVNKNWARF